MTLLRNVTMTPAAGPGIDAFARLRVSQPTLLLDTKQVGGAPDLFCSNGVSGSGSATYSINRSSTALTVGSAVGVAARQSKSRAIYQAGKSLLVFQTFVMAAGQTNLRQRVGLFSTKNGIFLQRDGTTLSIVRRTFLSGSAVDTVVAQASWNVDPMDGSGPSGITIDTTKAQILMLDLEWLGVGQVRCYFVVDGVPVWFHSFKNANNLTSVYMTNPNLPLRWEVEATGTITGTATLEAICGSVNSEGGYEINGVTSSVDMGSTVNQIAGGAFEEILAVRMQSAFTEFATAFVQAVSVIAATSSNFLWRLVLNPTETGAGTWANVPNSILERNITRVVTVDTGHRILSGYVASAINTIDTNERPILTLGTTLAGVTDVLSLQVMNLGTGNEEYLGSLILREVY